MKPSKDKTNKNDVNEKKSSSSIQDFFKAAPKQFVIEKECISDTKAFYVRALKEKLKCYDGDTENDKLDENSSPINENELNEVNGACALVPATHCDDNGAKTFCDRDECKKNAIQAREFETKYKDLKKNYVKLSVKFVEIEMKYDDLLKTATNTVHSDDTDGVLSPDNIFTANEIRYLQSIPLERAKDSTFILQCIQYAYKPNLSDLLCKTLKGTSERTEYNDDGTAEVHPAKNPLTPEKVNRIQELFIERVSKGPRNAAEFGERIKQSNINKLFASGIKNIVKKQKPQEKPSNENVGLNM